MNRYLLLIFLSSWSHVVPLSLQCETGFAYADHVLSVTRSSMAFADVAHLKTYTAEDVNACMNDCCTEKYGLCTVASFKKNTSEENCMHFNCRPINKCKYLSSNMTDSFSFSSSSVLQPLVPSSHTSRNHSSLISTAVSTKKPKLEKTTRMEQEHGVTKETISPFSEEQFALKNDNTTIKPRKGVDESVLESSFENTTRSGIKPRKGVSLDDVVLNNTTSKVKPRKGVGPYLPRPTLSQAIQELPVHTESSVTQNKHMQHSLSVKTDKDIANDLVSALEKVFEDDTSVNDPKPTSSKVESSFKSIESTPTVISSLETNYVTSVETSSTTSVVKTSTVSYLTSPPTKSTDLQSSFTSSRAVSNTVQTPNLHATDQPTKSFNTTPMPSKSSSTILEHSKLLFHEVSSESEIRSESKITEEAENERKYKSSMHLVLSLVFGLVVLFAVMGVVAKRVYDNWMRRHYRRMDFLIDGMYNGYE